MNVRILAYFVLLALATVHSAAEDSVVVSWSASTDIFLSSSFNKPSNHQRAYTTQPSRNNEIGLMLASIGLSVSGPNYRGRVALQEGWFARANYSGLDSSWRMLQEANVGVRVADGLWLDAGVMFSHIGYESMIGRNNLTLSRSFTADYTPYYSTGAALAWTVSDVVSVTGLVLNGWQQIVDINNDLAFGARVVVTPSSTLSFNWSTFVGNEQARGTASMVRFHNNFWVEWKATDRIIIVGLADVCLQDTPADTSTKQWYAGVTAAYSPSDQFRIATRVEHYNDPANMFIATPTRGPFQASAASLNLDYRPNDAVLVRGEIRTMIAGEKVFPSHDGLKSSDTYITVSTSIAFGGNLY